MRVNSLPTENCYEDKEEGVIEEDKNKYLCTEPC